MTALLRLPRIEPQTVTVSHGVAPANLPPIGSCWSHDGEIVMIGETRDVSWSIQLVRGIRGVVKTHEAAFWSEVPVYEP